MKRILKYATGDKVPNNAQYLFSCKNGDVDERGYPIGYKYVWHYFLVEVEEQ